MTDLPPLDFQPSALPPLVPQPEVHELPADEGWRMWDAAVATRDAQERTQ